MDIAVIRNMHGWQILCDNRVIVTKGALSAYTDDYVKAMQYYRDRSTIYETLMHEGKSAPAIVDGVDDVGRLILYVRQDA